MTAFLLDQNVNRKSLARKCNAEAGATLVKRFPIEWKQYPSGFKDPQLLPIVMAGTRTLIANDRLIARSYPHLIPEMNPGIIIVGHPPRHIRPLGKGEIDKIIAQFKNRFPAWNTVRWSNSIVEITPVSFEIYHIRAAKFEADFQSEYREANWAALAEAALETNALRSGLPE